MLKGKYLYFKYNTNSGRMRVFHTGILILILSAFAAGTLILSTRSELLWLFYVSLFFYLMLSLGFVTFWILMGINLFGESKQRKKYRYFMVNAKNKRACINQKRKIEQDYDDICPKQEVKKEINEILGECNIKKYTLYGCTHEGILRIIRKTISENEWNAELVTYPCRKMKIKKMQENTRNRKCDVCSNTKCRTKAENSTSSGQVQFFAFEIRFKNIKNYI